MGDIKFSIITPWLPPRETIHRSIKCIDDQTYGNWEHLIAIDRHGYNLESNDPRRFIYPCEVEHNTWGNSCRHSMWHKATGDWILYLDDDDILYPTVLEEVYRAIINSPEDLDWGYFAIKLGEGKFFNYPPGGGLITGGQVFHKKILNDGTECFWYDNANYGADWDLIYQRFVRFDRKPILIDKILGQLPKHGVGKV